MTNSVDEHGRSMTAHYFTDLSKTLELVPSETIDQVVRLILEARQEGRRVYVMGNGGSAAIATHFVCDLSKTAIVPGFRPIRAFSLTDNMSVVTAWANDTAYDRTFAEQINGLVEPYDLVIAISSSGNSPNIVEGLQAACSCGATTIAFVGFDGGKALELADLVVHVPRHNYGLVEDSHAAIGHAVTAAIRHQLVSQSKRMADVESFISPVPMELGVEDPIAATGGQVSAPAFEEHAGATG